jgi:glycosyltransferase involved in cell wall biosynthesis
LTVFFLIPGDLAALTGGYAYDRRIIEELTALGLDVRYQALDGSYPDPTPGAVADTAARLAALPDGATVLVDGLAYGVMAESIAPHAGRLRIVALVHHPLALETGHSEEARERLAAAETRALAFSDAVIATSATTARALVADFGVAEDRLATAPPGVDAVPFVEPDAAAEPLILSVGTLIPRKGHELLVAALARLAHLPWRARIVGGARDAACAEGLRKAIADAGLAGRIELAGEIADMEPEWRRATLFALATRHEGYGMVFAEAIAHGLPIVGCAAGAVPEVVPPEAGILVPVDDVEALAGALKTLLTDPAKRASLAAGARSAAANLPTWRGSAEIIAAVLR